MRYPTSRPRRSAAAPDASSADHAAAICSRAAADGRVLDDLEPCLACRSRCLEAGREQRLCPTMLSVAGGEQAGCILHVLGRERNNPELHDRSLAETKLVRADARRL